MKDVKKYKRLLQFEMRDLCMFYIRGKDVKDSIKGIKNLNIKKSNTVKHATLKQQLR